VAITRSASRVLPIPPGPHRVTARAAPIRSHSSASSRARPTKLFGSAGRLAGISATSFPCALLPRGQQYVGGVRCPGLPNT